MTMEQSVPKRRHIKFRLRVITQNKACEIKIDLGGMQYEVVIQWVKVAESNDLNDLL